MTLIQTIRHHANPKRLIGSWESFFVIVGFLYHVHMLADLAINHIIL